MVQRCRAGRVGSAGYVGFAGHDGFAGHVGRAGRLGRVELLYRHRVASKLGATARTSRACTVQTAAGGRLQVTQSVTALRTMQSIIGVLSKLSFTDCAPL